VPGTAPVLPGVITAQDIRGYSVVSHAPTHVSYRGLDVYSIAPSSSGGTTVGEALNILENVNLRKVSQAQALHDYLEATRRAYADRNRYIGDPAYLGRRGGTRCGSC
jgi:gamma-glutamyltranspeptidase/glutathione hydrolase